MPVACNRDFSHAIPSTGRRDYDSFLFRAFALEPQGECQPLIGFSVAALVPVLSIVFGCITAVPLLAARPWMLISGRDSGRSDPNETACTTPRVHPLVMTPAGRPASSSSISVTTWPRGRFRVTNTFNFSPCTNRSRSRAIGHMSAPGGRASQESV